jgi:FemAB-related protein (PEP-CTERM system-associated)
MTTTTVVAELAPRDHAAWDDYVRSHPRATFFHQLCWRRVLEASFGYAAHYLVARRAGVLTGVLPLFACAGPTGKRRLVSLPHSVYGGALADDRDAELALIGEARRLAIRIGAGAIELRNRCQPHVALAPLPIAVTFEKALPLRAADVLALLPGKSRNKVRQSARSGLATRIVDDVDAFHVLLADSYHRLGTPLLPRALFAHAAREFPEHAFIMFVDDGSRAIAAAFTLVFRGTAMPVWTGEARGTRASNFLFARLMELAVERGCRRFDLGRTLVGNGGGLAFKRHQGFEPEPLPYQLDIVDGRAHAPLDPYRGWALRARQAWTRLPPWLAGSLGPAIVRFFP